MTTCGNMSHFLFSDRDYVEPLVEPFCKFHMCKLYYLFLLLSAQQSLNESTLALDYRFESFDAGRSYTLIREKCWQCHQIACFFLFYLLYSFDAH